MINPGRGKKASKQTGGTQQVIYTLGTFMIMIAAVIFAGMMLFLLSVMIVAVRAGAEALANAATVLMRKLVASALHRPEIPAVHTVPYHPTLRK
jgi:hypothetical protein